MKKHLCTFLSIAAVIRLSAQIEVVSGGNVGTGTTSPAASLDVNGALVVTGGVAAAGTYSVNAIGAASADRDVFLAGAAGLSTGFTVQRVSGAMKYVFNDGKVGIGTTSPEAALQVVGGNLFVNPVGDATGGLYYGGAANGLIVGKYSTAPWPGTNGLFVGGASLLMGNVGIGTTSPSQKLEVAGSVKATSFISSTTTYADFVFKPGYQLPSLAETKAAIQRDGHLPGIPSEAEAREHGIDLAAMQVKLLQKIEELTLQQIEQEK